MPPRYLTRLAGVLALTSAGIALAQGQVCIHRTADGRCLHWVPTVTDPARDPRQPPWQGPAPTTGCIYDPGTGTRRQCWHITADGRCVHLGGPCN